MTSVLYPGSFDPIHNGHLEIIERASKLFDDVLVAAMGNPQKGSAVFTFEERQEMILEACAHLDNVRVTKFSSLVVDLARAEKVDFIVRGIRMITDFESELQMAQTNHTISGVDTVFIPCGTTSGFIAGKLVREIARFGGDVSAMVPDGVARRLKERLS